jgi:hypothetical protein
LIEAGADVNAQDNSSASPLELAAWRGKAEVVDLLIEKGARVPAEGKQRQSMLLYACKKGLAKLFQKLAVQEAELTIPSSTQGTLLHEASVGGASAIISALVDKGLNINQKDRFGWAPIHYAAKNGNVEALGVLLEKGANLNARTRMGQSALNIAEENGAGAAKEFLLSKRADPKPIQFPLLKGPYLGLKPPGMKPEIFGLGIVSSTWGLHSSVVFSPDGRDLFWTPAMDRPGQIYSTNVLLAMRNNGGRWTPPRAAPFSIIAQDGDDGEPFFAPDGKRLYFISRRPFPGQEGQREENIWVVDRMAEGWSEPRPVDPAVNDMEIHWQFSVDKDGNLYFGSSEAGGNGMSDVYRARYVEGRYRKPENLGPVINTAETEHNPFIAPDGSYLLFNRGSTLFITYSEKDGSWTEPKAMGPGINDGGALCPIVTSDGKYLFFLSGREGKNHAYWVDAGTIRDMKPKP